MDDLSQLDSFRFLGSAEVSLLGAMGGMNRPSHNSQGGSHGQYSRSDPHAPRSGTAPATTPGTALDPREAPATAPRLPTPTGPAGPHRPASDRAQPPPTPRVGPQSLRTPG